MSSPRCREHTGVHMFSQEKCFLRNKALGCQLVFLAWLFYLSSSHRQPPTFKCVRIRCVVQVPRGTKSRNSRAPTKGEAQQKGCCHLWPHTVPPLLCSCVQRSCGPHGEGGESSAPSGSSSCPRPQPLSRAFRAHSWPRPPSLRPGVPTLVQCEVPGQVLFWT